MKETRRERSKSNQVLMQNRNSGYLLGSGCSTNTRSLFYTSTTGVDVYEEIIVCSCHIKNEKQCFYIRYFILQVYIQWRRWRQWRGGDGGNVEGGSG